MLSGLIGNISTIDLEWLLTSMWTILKYGLIYTGDSSFMMVYSVVYGKLKLCLIP